MARMHGQATKINAAAQIARLTPEADREPTAPEGLRPSRLAVA